MPLLYLAKVNLNSNIFQVYNKSLDIEKVKNIIYDKFSMGNDYSDISKEKYVDSLGNIFPYSKKSVYSFQEIEKLNDGIITGKLVRAFNRPSEELDDNTKKMVPSSVTEKVSIFFYFSVYDEMIAFSERQSFGYNQFMSAFASLLNKCTEPYKFELFLQKDKDLLEEKLKSLKCVKKVKATLIPPNSNEEDLNELRLELQYMRQCQDANATKLDLVYSSEDMNMDSIVMKEIKMAVSRGYGEFNATGINDTGGEQTVRSNTDAAYTINIRENIDKEDFKEESKNMIIRFLHKTRNNILGRKEEAKV